MHRHTSQALIKETTLLISARWNGWRPARSITGEQSGFVREPEDLGRPAPVRAIQAHPFLEVAVAEFRELFRCRLLDPGGHDPQEQHPAVSGRF